jgi:hypothetical protein
MDDPARAGMPQGAMGITDGAFDGDASTGSWVRLPFAVDDHFHPTGCMLSDGDCGGPRLTIDTDRCPAPRLPGAQGQCHRFYYQPVSEPTATEPYAMWLWQYGDNNWGQSPGLSIEPGAERVSFSAAATRAGVRVRFRAGGTNRPLQPGAGLPFQDDFVREIEIVLTQTLSRYEIPLADASYARVIAAFGWAIGGVSEGTPVEFFVDDVRWE